MGFFRRCWGGGWQRACLGLTWLTSCHNVHMHTMSQVVEPPNQSFMPRPRKTRHCRHYAGDRVFKPRSIPMPELHVVHLREDELEALRLCDLEGFDQAGAGERMGVSRGTVQRLLKTGRKKLVRVLVENQALIIGGETLKEKGTSES